MKNLILLLSLILSAPVYASEMKGALSAGLGNTGRAAVEPNESLYLNPAAIALVSGFYSGGQYQSGFLQKDVSRNSYGVVLTDGTEGVMFPGSFGYRRHHYNNHGNSISEDEFKIAFGKRIAERLSLGLGVIHSRAIDHAGQRINQTNIDLGFLLALLPNWGISLSGENIVEQHGNVPSALLRASQVAFGTQYILGQAFTLRYEALLPLYLENTQYLAHRVGLGVVVRSSFGLSGGYTVDDQRQQNWASLGLSWRGPRLKLAYSYQKEQRSDLGVRHLVDLWFDF